MNVKHSKKSPIHENADANITCDFGDGDINRSRSRLPHTYIHRYLDYIKIICAIYPLPGEEPQPGGRERSVGGRTETETDETKVVPKSPASQESTGFVVVSQRDVHRDSRLAEEVEACRGVDGSEQRIGYEQRPHRRLCPRQRSRGREADSRP